MLLLSALLLRSASAQSTVIQGPLSCGVPVVESITQGDTHSWSFSVDPSQAQSGTSLTDLVFALQSSIGSSSLYVTPPGATAALQSTSQTSGAGLLFTNRTGTGVLYGSYLVQVLGVATDTYTLSVTLSQRHQTSAGVPLAVGSIYPPLATGAAVQPYVYTYVDYVVQQAGPWQMSLTVTVDEAALLSAGGSLSTTVMPTVYWARGVDPLAWSPTTATWSTMQSAVEQQVVSGLAALASAYDECTQPPCRYSFLVAPSVALPVQPSMLITLVEPSTAYSSALDYTQLPSYVPGLGQNLSVTTPSATVSSLSVTYYQFPVYDPAVDLSLAITTATADCRIVALVSLQNPVPDLAQKGYTWAMSLPANATLDINWLDPYFTVAGGYWSTEEPQSTTMEGTYYVAAYVYGGTSCTYQLSLTVMDPTYAAGPGAKLLKVGVRVNGTSYRDSGVSFYRFITPPGYDSSTTDIVFTVTGGWGIYVSDLSAKPDSSNYIVREQSDSAGQTPLSVILSAALGQTHVGTFWVAIVNSYLAHDIIVSLVTHTPLQAGVAYISTQPLLTGQPALFQWSQPGLSAAAMRITLDITDPTAYGLVFVSTFPRSTLTAEVTAAWPVNINSATWSLIGSAYDSGLLMGEYNFSCAATVDCVWLVTVLATSPDGLVNYSLTLTQDNIDPPVITLAPNAAYNSKIIGLPLYSDYFVVTPTQPAVLTITLRGGGSSWLLVDRDRSLLYGLSRSAEYTKLLYGSSGVNATIVISPADPTFGLNAADNIGSPFVGSFYIEVACFGNCDISPYQLTYNTSPYNSTEPVLVPLVVTPASPVYQSLLGGAYAYYTYVSPATVTATTDLTFAVMNRATYYVGTPSLFISTTAQFPSLPSGAYNYTASGYGATSVLLSGSTIVPSTAYHVAVLAGQGNDLNFAFAVSVSNRATLTGAGTVAIADPVSAGTVTYVDLTLPGSLTPTNQPTYSFVAGVVCSTLSNGSLPALAYSTSLSSGASSVPPTISSAYYAPVSATQPAPSGQWWSIGGQQCTLQSCSWHMAVLMPAGAAGCLLAVSNVQTATQPLLPTAVPSDGTAVSGSVAAAAASWYTFSVPASMLNGAAVTVTLTPSSAAVQLNMQVAASGLPVNAADGLSVSTRAGEAAVAAFNSSGAFPYLMIRAPAVLRPTYSVGVIGVTAGTYTIAVSVTAIPLENTPDIYAQLSLDPSVGNSSVVLTKHLATLRLSIPANYNATTDVSVVWESAQPYGLVLCASRNLLFTTLGCGNIDYDGLPAILPPIFYFGPTWLAPQVMTFNSIFTPEVQPDDTIYVYTSTQVIRRLTLLIQQRLQPVYGQAINMQLSTNRPVYAQISMPAMKVSGNWQTPISFFAALTSTAVGSTTPLPASIFMRNANNAAQSLQIDEFDKASKGDKVTESLMVNDLCTISVCTWPMMLWATEPVNVSFSVSGVGSVLPVVPGFVTAATYVGQDAINTYSFTLPHQRMSLAFTLQSLVTGQYEGNNTNADLFVSQTSSRPAPDNSGWSSQADITAATDSLAIDLTTGGQPANGTWYVGVFGQRAGWYTLSVTATDAGGASIILSLNTMVGGATNVRSSQYYQYQIGQVDALTDLSLVLIDGSGNQSSALPHPLLYSTFSYTEPGPVAGYLPALLPYELLASTSSANGIQQITLNTALSSSNLLPLQSQHSLYVAVYGSPPSTGSWAAQLVPYSISVSVTERLLLTTDNTAAAAVQLTRVSAGTVQYYQFSFTQSAAPISAVIALTGESSAIAALPAVYIADPTITALVDPVISTPQSYTAVMSPAPVTSASIRPYNAVMLPITTVCPPRGSSGCVWKAMVFTAVPMSAYSFAVTTNTAASTASLSPDTPVTSSLAGGSFAYYSFALSSASTITLTTLDAVGNVDLFVSNVNAYPYYAFNGSSGSYVGSQWQSTVDGGVSQPDVVWLNSSSTAFVAPAHYYVAVFAQRAAAFTLTLSAPGGRQSSSSSSSSSAAHSSSYSSSNSSSSSSSAPAGAIVLSESSGLTSMEVALLASFVPIVFFLCLMVVLLGVVVLRRTRNVQTKSDDSAAEHSTSRSFDAVEDGIIEMSHRSEQDA